ncbi:MAG: glycosyltransferase family 4 protein [Kiritimatiellae bacterium]|nr:glycosyltransferase family 4 protein [Kiritimatiellia bacterium]
MKILLFLEKSNVRGGIEVFAERQAEQLRTEGHQVQILHSFDLQAVCSCDQIIVHKCTDVATLEKFPAEKTVCYVHDHEPICPRAYAYTPLQHNCTRSSGLFPCLFCAPLCRSWKAALHRVFVQARRKRVLSRFSRIIVISEFMKGRLVANGIPADRIAVSPPPLPDYTTVLDNDATRIATPIDLLFVGQLIRGKGVHLLLKTMAKMKTPRTLDVVGTGNMESRLKAQATRLGLADRIRWYGFQKHPQEWMRVARCVVVPSFWQEPYGLVAAEAVALGKPVVAFAIGGLPEACHGKATLVPPGDVDALAEALDATADRDENGETT